MTYYVYVRSRKTQNSGLLLGDLQIVYNKEKSEGLYINYKEMTN